MIKVLSVGNSFSVDAMRYLAPVSELENNPMRTLTLYIGGCRLSLHHENMNSEAKAYEAMYDHTLKGFVSMEEAMLADDWSVVTFQQQSSSSADYRTFQPYLNDLSAYARRLCPHAKQIMHQTWAYETGSNKIHTAGYETYEEMFAPIRASYAQAVSDINADGIIPSGEAMRLLKDNGFPHIHADNFHAQRDVARLLLAALWYTCLTGALPEKAVREIKTDFTVTAEQRELILKVIPLAINSK